MATFKVFSRMFSRQNFCNVLRKNMHTVKRGRSRSLFSVVNTNRTTPVQYKTGLISTSFSRVCGCGMHNNISEGDQQLLAFLKEELDYENETMKNLEKPKLEVFNQPDDLKNMKFKMTKLMNGERIVVSFDVDQSTNHESYVSEDDDDEGKITSYPSFSIQIIKDSGETMHFNCEYNIDDDESSPEEEPTDLFSLIDVCLLPHPDADHNTVYHCDTDNMDYNLYELLMGMLTERGVDNEFLADLLRKSTILEHQHYVQFLKGLQDFLTQK